MLSRHGYFRGVVVHLPSLQLIWNQRFPDEIGFVSIGLLTGVKQMLDILRRASQVPVSSLPLTAREGEER